jgi:uncharacterized repeat protein (TIGR01451 family)
MAAGATSVAQTVASHFAQPQRDPLKLRAMHPLHLIVACLLVGAVAGAQPLEPLPLRIDVVAEQLVTNELAPGRVVRRFEPARQVRPYEEVYYTVRVQNSADHPVYPVVVTRPVPENTAYVAGSAVGPAATVTFSVDEGVTFAAPDALQVPTPEGSSRNAVERDYTHIRWELGYPLAAGATAILRFRVMLR